MTTPHYGASSVVLQYQLFGDDLIADAILPLIQPNTNSRTTLATQAALRLGDNSALRQRRSDLLAVLGARA